MTAAGADPRKSPRDPRDVRPIVGAKGAGLPVGLLFIAMGLAAIMLFTLLETRRQSLTAPSTRVRAADIAGPSAVPVPLFIPPETGILNPPLAAPAPADRPIFPAPSRLTPPSPSNSIAYSPPAPTLSVPQLELPARSGSAGPALVIDATNAGVDGAPERNVSDGVVSGSDPSGGGLTGSSRVRAGRFVNPATTVSQGTLIPAVLETALDSTRPGQVRALVSRAVRGFDGSQVLIPRGSRLFGEYRADLQPGQNRAFIQWTRLIRPDGITIAIGSPAADPLGRAGIRGKVDTHFFEQFGSAILQSSLDIGVGVATRRLGGTTVVLVPGTAQAAAGSIAPSRQVQPTLTVKQGARVTVFVARDLDFAGADVFAK